MNSTAEAVVSDGSSGSKQIRITAMVIAKPPSERTPRHASTGSIKPTVSAPQIHMDVVRL